MGALRLDLLHEEADARETLARVSIPGAGEDVRCIHGLSPVAAAPSRPLMGSAESEPLRRHIAPYASKSYLHSVPPLLRSKFNGRYYDAVQTDL
eukprot:2800387-Rhodomonas_salina.2